MYKRQVYATTPLADFPCSASPQPVQVLSVPKQLARKHLAESFPKTRRSVLEPFCLSSNRGEKWSKRGDIHRRIRYQIHQPGTSRLYRVWRCFKEPRRVFFRVFSNTIFSIKSFYKKLKNASCEDDRLNGWNSTLQAAWYIRHDRSLDVVIPSCKTVVFALFQILTIATISIPPLPTVRQK